MEVTHFKKGLLLVIAILAGKETLIVIPTVATGASL